MNARWDLAIPALLVTAYAAIFWAMGYWQGRKGAEDRQLIVADWNRVKMARAQQLYDWERDGI